MESSSIVSAENPGSQPEDAEKTEKRNPTSELWGPWYVPSPDSQEFRQASAAQFKKPGELQEPAPPLPLEQMGIDPQASYREHVSAPLLQPPASIGALPGAGTPSGAPHSAYPLSGAHPPDTSGMTGYPPIQSYPPPGQGYPPVPTYPGVASPAMPSNPSYQGYTSGPPLPQGHPSYDAYNGYVPPPYPVPYPPYPPYPFYPPRPKRDGYLFGVGIASFVGSILVLLGGLFSLLVLTLLLAAPQSQLTPDQLFMSIVTIAAFALIGVIGGSYSLYHSIRSAFLRKPSAGFALPTFWLFVVLYLGVLGAGYALHVRGQDVTNEPLTVFLILMAGLLPALAVLALGNRRLRFPKKAAWPTTWRRFALAIVSGATLGVLVAGILEFVFQVVLVRGQGIDPYLCLNNPNAPQCQNPQIYNLLFIAVAIIAPLVEEAVKPLAAVILIGRVRSAAEAFVLGLSCGIGFDLIETSGYISSSYTDWLNTALVRTGAGLLHGLGAAMVVLGWYFITHPGKNRVPKALGCWLYAVIQHAVWNGSWGLVLLPGSIGQYFSNTLTLGSVSLPYYAFINIGEAVIMLAFFLYMTGRLRRASSPAMGAQQAPG
jgi:RsiW-degrading membrane proteinase PrsW (M82 family)